MDPTHVVSPTGRTLCGHRVRPDRLRYGVKQQGKHQSKNRLARPGELPTCKHCREVLEGKRTQSVKPNSAAISEMRRRVYGK